MFISLIACSKAQNPSSITTSKDLNAKNQENITNALYSVYVKYSDLIERLKTKRTHEEFGPYIEMYESYKGSSVDPSIKIFFFDPSKLPKNHITKFMHGICFKPGFEEAKFIFIDKDYWLNASLTDILSSTYSKYDLLSDGTIEYKNSILKIDTTGIESYQKLSEEDKQDQIDIMRELEANLSIEEKVQARKLRREILLFHELGHCDLNLGHEINTASIMNYATLGLLRKEAIKEKRCPEEGLYMEAVEKCASIDLEASYANLIQELFLPPQNISKIPPIRLNPEAQRLFYQEALQYMEIYTQAIDPNVERSDIY